MIIAALNDAGLFIFVVGLPLTTAVRIPANENSKQNGTCLFLLTKPLLTNENCDFGQEKSQIGRASLNFQQAVFETIFISYLILDLLNLELR